MNNGRISSMVALTAAMSMCPDMFAETAVRQFCAGKGRWKKDPEATLKYRVANRIRKANNFRKRYKKPLLNAEEIDGIIKETAAEVAKELGLEDQRPPEEGPGPGAGDERTVREAPEGDGGDARGEHLPEQEGV